MRFAFLFVVFLAGCASQAAKEPESFDAASKEPFCARQCLTGYSNCMGNAGVTTNRFIANDMLNACQANTRQCLNTCPAR